MEGDPAMSEWPHQTFGISEVIRHIGEGTRRICLTSPTGGGKSRIAVRLTEWALDNLGPVAVYTPRKMLTEQLARTFRDHQVPYGVMAADFDDECRLGEPVQICAPATIHARCFKKVRWQPHNAKLVLIDEIHLQKGDMIRQIADYHYNQGAFIVPLTATPIGVSDMADTLVVAGTNSELRQCGALLPAYVYGCEEIDTTKIKPKAGSGEFSHADIKSVWPAEIFGYVVEHYKELNPEKKPSILFAPGVAESIWFAEQFCEAGYRWAHIDGEDCWLDGEFHKSNREIRDEILRLHKNGDVLGICNRFVLREGVDLPHLYHGILATPIGSMVSYVQVVGRILRASPDMDHVIIQDHGGNWHRHGSPNQNRDWAAYWSMPEHYASAVREERIRSKKEPEPIHCPKCHAIRTHGDKCLECGYSHQTKSRMVIQHSGKLKEMTGDIFKPRYTRRDPDTQEKWLNCYYRTLRARDRDNKTFREAVGLFVHENHYYPPRDLDMMPTNEADWFRAVKDVHVSQLTGLPPAKAAPKPQPEGSLFP